MKLSSSLLQAITLSVSVATLTATTTSCEKDKMERTKVEKAAERANAEQPEPTACPACGMG